MYTDDKWDYLIKKLNFRIETMENSPYCDKRKLKLFYELRDRYKSGERSKVLFEAIWGRVIL